MAEESRKMKHRKDKFPREMNTVSTKSSDTSRSLNASRDPFERAEMTNQDQELPDIVWMSKESLIDSLKSMEAVILYQYSADIVEETFILMNKIAIFFINLRTSLWPVLEKYRKTLCEIAMEKIQKCLLFTPVSNSFNYISCMVGQFWAIIIMTAKCCGERFANMRIGYFLLSLLLGKEIPSLLFIFILMPLFAYLLNQKTSMDKLSLAERRWLVLVFSFWVGASMHYILINWDLGVLPSPPFYSSTLVALLFEFIGPMLAHNRPLLLLNTIGIASCVCFIYAYIYACFTFTYFYTSLIAIASSFYSMQQHLADPKLGYFVLFFVFLCRGDVSQGYVLLPIQSMYNQLAFTLIFGHYIWKRDTYGIKPDAVEERYTLLFRQLH